VDKSGSSRLHRLPAPYISDVGNLINHHYSHLQTVYYRTGGPGGVEKKDIFAAGNFPVIQKTWSEPSDIPMLSGNTEGSALAGYISYEAGYASEERWLKLPVPTTGYAYRFFEITCWYEIDHQSETATIVHLQDCSSEDLEVLSAIVKSSESPSTHNESAKLGSGTLEALGELKESEYVDRINQILEDICAGRYYELNFTQRFRCESRKNPRTLFVALLKRLSAERAFFGDFGDEIVCSCSPELFLQKRGQLIWTAPIKGSFYSIPDPQTLEKLYAEHTMVVDLARNDLGRISDQAWVFVSELNTVRKFGEISHLESTILGRTSQNWLDLLPAVLPAASITGAPKVEVVQAIAEYENSPRGLYTGNCGWIWPNGDVDLNVAIRTFMARRSPDKWQYELGAGGAIVADSIPAEEYRECLRKAEPLIAELLTCE